MGNIDLWRIEFDTVEQAAYFSVLLDGNTFDRRPEVEGVAVTITRDAIESLRSNFSEDDDGYVDDARVWIGGTPYAQVPAGAVWDGNA